jgi:putative tryptophan/tyrosine transport system substrate-binding protein
VRRVILPLAAAVLAALPLAGEPTRKIVILRSGSFPIYDFAVQGFKEGLAARNVPAVLEEKVLPSDESADLDAFMESVRAKSPDLVFTVGTMATRVVQERGGGLPFTYCMIVDPPSLGVMGGGTVMEAHPARQIAFIRETFPSLRRIGVIHSGSRNRETVRLFKEEARKDERLVLVQAENAEQVSKAILRLSREVDCLLMISDAVLYSPQTATQIILQTLQNDLPLIAVSPSFVKAGALAGIYPDYRDNGVLAAEAAARYFHGEPLKSIGVLWPNKLLSAVNLILANRLNIDVPKAAVDAASEVVR